MGDIWVRQDPGGLHVGPMNFVIWDMLIYIRPKRHNFYAKQSMVQDPVTISHFLVLWNRSEPSATGTVIITATET